MTDLLRAEGLNAFYGASQILFDVDLVLHEKKTLALLGRNGNGKTTLARLMAHAFEAEFVALSAVFSGVADLRKVFEAARQRRKDGRGTLLFVDEVHRFNRAQQDSFLPVMEDGTVVLVGATTENPSFELNAALLSRARVLTFKSLDEEAIGKLLKRAEEIEGKPLPLDADVRLALIRMADGDGRASLTLTEEIWRAARPGEIFDTAALQGIVQRRAPIYDKKQDGHYNLISALHKSVRGSDPDAALYYLARMLDVVATDKDHLAGDQHTVIQGKAGEMRNLLHRNCGWHRDTATTVLTVGARAGAPAAAPGRTASSTREGRSTPPRRDQLRCESGDQSPA